MSTARQENGSRPLSTADLARAARRPEDTPNERTGESVDYEQEEVTRMDVAQPPSLKPAAGPAAPRSCSGRPGMPMFI